MSGKESSATLSKLQRTRYSNPRYTDEGGERGGARRGGGVASDALHPRGRRGGGRAGGRAGGQARVEESPEAEMEGQSRDEETQSRDEEPASGEEDPMAPKKLKCRGESTVLDESQEPATEEARTLIKGNGKS